MMLSDWELWACATATLKQHGVRARLVVAERIGALTLAGDAAGVEAWQKIAGRMDRVLAARDGRC